MEEEKKVTEINKEIDKIEDKAETLPNVHHGHNIRRVRIMKDIKQEMLAEKMNVTQSMISRYEKEKVLNDDVLNQAAQALEVPVEHLKTMEENLPESTFGTNNNTFTTTNTNSYNTKGGAQVIEEGVIINNNPINPTNHSDNNSDNNSSDALDKVLELYRHLLQEKEERYASIEKSLEEIKQKLKD